MAVLSKVTIQRLAVLRALSMWQRGAYGPLRLHKALFFADKNTPAGWRLFTFKKWRLGQYSDEIAGTLNALRQAGRITTRYDGPSERMKADLPKATSRLLEEFFREYFPAWNENLTRSFHDWAYLDNDTIIDRAHDDPSYTRTQRGEVIFSSFDADLVEFSDLDSQVAEEFSDLVDVGLQQGLLTRLAVAAERPAKGEDWRQLYFGEGPRNPAKAAGSAHGHH